MNKLNFQEYNWESFEDINTEKSSDNHLMQHGDIVIRAKHIIDEDRKERVEHNLKLYAQERFLPCLNSNSSNKDSDLISFATLLKRLCI
jgi:hypothetical protein